MIKSNEHTAIEKTDHQEHNDSFIKRVVIVASITILMILLLLFLLGTLSLLPLLFLSVLIALSLRGVANQIQKYTPFGHNASLLLLLISIVSVIGVATVIWGPIVSEQVAQFTETIPQSINDLRVQLSETQWGTWIITQVEQVSTRDLPLASSDMFTRLSGVFSSTLSGLTNAFIILFVGVYLAVEPSIYVDNIVRLVPESRRTRMREVLDTITDKLRDWVLARLGSMIVVGVLTTIGLYLLDVPLALTLGIIAGLLSFIPNFGPIIATIPAGLVGFTVSPQMGLLYIPLLYTAIQQIENNLITPVIERETVSLPPALTMSLQLILTVIVGQFGLIVAAPFATMMIVVVRMLYIEDVLGDRGDTPQNMAESQ